MEVRRWCQMVLYPPLEAPNLLHPRYGTGAICAIEVRKVSVQQRREASWCLVVGTYELVEWNENGSSQWSELQCLRGLGKERWHLAGMRHLHHGRTARVSKMSSRNEVGLHGSMPWLREYPATSSSRKTSFSTFGVYVTAAVCSRLMRAAKAVRPR